MGEGEEEGGGIEIVQWCSCLAGLLQTMHEKWPDGLNLAESVQTARAFCYVRNLRKTVIYLKQHNNVVKQDDKHTLIDCGGLEKMTFLDKKTTVM